MRNLPGALPERAPLADDDPARCFNIERINLQGATLVTPAQQANLLEPFIGRCLGANQLNDVLSVVTAYYLDRGYVTDRAYLPQQDLSDGELEILVIEGVLRGWTALNWPAIANWRWHSQTTWVTGSICAN